MLTESCSKEILLLDIKELESLYLILNNAFTSYETNKDLVRDPQRWVDLITEKLTYALTLIASKEDYPEAQEQLFAKLKKACDAADDRMPGYKKRKNLPD